MLAGGLDDRPLPFPHVMATVAAPSGRHSARRKTGRGPARSVARSETLDTQTNIRHDPWHFSKEEALRATEQPIYTGTAVGKAFLAMIGKQAE